MKWGVHRATRKQSRNQRLEKKALNYDIKSAKIRKKADSIHAKDDLERSNRAVKKAAKYQVKSAKLQKKANASSNDMDTVRLESKAAKMAYKGRKYQMKADRINRETGYGAKASKYSIKSDKMAVKAAKVRAEIAANEAYVSRMKQKASSIPKEDVLAGKDFIREFLNDE